jgi:hypothetical protein
MEISLFKIRQIIQETLLQTPLFMVFFNQLLTAEFMNNRQFA